MKTDTIKKNHYIKEGVVTFFLNLASIPLRLFLVGLPSVIIVSIAGYILYRFTWDPNLIYVLIAGLTAEAIAIFFWTQFVGRYDKKSSEEKTAANTISVGALIFLGFLYMKFIQPLGLDLSFIIWFCIAAVFIAAFLNALANVIDSKNIDKRKAAGGYRWHSQYYTSRAEQKERRRSDRGAYRRNSYDQYYKERKQKSWRDRAYRSEHTAGGTSSGTDYVYFKDMTPQQAKDVYRKLAKTYHPDNPDTGNTEMMQRVMEEYKRHTAEFGEA